MFCPILCGQSNMYSEGKNEPACRAASWFWLSHPIPKIREMPIWSRLIPIQVMHTNAVDRNRTSMAVFFVIVNTPMYFLFPWTLSFLEDRHQRLVHLRKIRIKEDSSNLPGSQQHQGSDKDTKHSLCTHFLYLRYVF